MSPEHNQAKETPEESRGYIPQVHLEPEQPIESEHSLPDSNADDAPLPEQSPFEHMQSQQEPEIPEPVIPEQPEEADVPQEPERPIPTEEPIIIPPVPPTPQEPEPAADEPQKPKKKKLFIALTCLFVVLALAIIGGISYVYFVIKPYERYDKIMPNVYCAGINLGGMTKEEAKDAIEELIPEVTFDILEDTMLPNEYVELQGEELMLFQRLVNLLNEVDDVQQVYHNVRNINDSAE